MKNIDWNKKYTTISMYAFLVICASIIFHNIIDKMPTIKENFNIITTTLQPFTIGFIMAYLLNFILSFFEKHILSIKYINRLNKKTKRSIGLSLTYLTTFTLFYLLGKFVIPQVIESLTVLANEIPNYITNLSKTIEEFSKVANIDAKYIDILMEKWQEILNCILTLLSSFIPALGNLLKATLSSIWNIIIGLVISIYMLADKERFAALTKKIIIALFSKQNSNIILMLVRRSNNTFGKFLSGQITDSILIGIITFIVLNIFKMPYAILISVIVCITNIIPFFGPFFGAIPSFLIILLVSPTKALWFLVIITIIQQIDGNIISPRILSGSIGISPFWILFSLLVTGKLLGLIGMIIGVPLFAIIYSIIKDVIEISLEKKGLPQETTDYMN